MVWERLNLGRRVARDRSRGPWSGEIGGFCRRLTGSSRGLCAICGRRFEPFEEASSFSSELKRRSPIKTTREISPSAARHGGSPRVRACKRLIPTRFWQVVDQTGPASRKRFHPTHASFGGRDRNRGVPVASTCSVVLLLAVGACSERTTAPSESEQPSPALAAAGVGSWASRASMPTPRQGLAAAVVQNGSGQYLLYAIGGCCGTSGATSALARVEAYNASTNRRRGHY